MEARTLFSASQNLIVAKRIFSTSMDNGSVDGPAPAAFIDQAVAYSKSRAQINELLQLKGTLIVQDISVDLLDFSWTAESNRLCKRIFMSPQVIIAIPRISANNHKI